MATPPEDRPKHQRLDDVPREPRTIGAPGDALVLAGGEASPSPVGTAAVVTAIATGYGIWNLFFAAAWFEVVLGLLGVSFALAFVWGAMTSVRRAESRLHWLGMTGQVMARGAVVKGTIVRKGRHYYARYQPPCSPKPLEIRLKEGIDNRASYWIGEENGVDVICHPDWPQDALCPSVLGTRFVPQHVVDARKRQDFSSQAASEPPRFIEVTLHNALSWFDTTRRYRLWRWLRRGTPSGGRLTLRDTFLVMRKYGGEPVEMDLTRPFLANLSVWPVSDTVAEVNVTLRQRGALPNVTPIAFKVGLPQVALSPELPIKREYLPMIARSEFEPLWHALRYYAQHHGERLDQTLHAPSINPRH